MVCNPYIKAIKTRNKASYNIPIFPRNKASYYIPIFPCNKASYYIPIFHCVILFLFDSFLNECFEMCGSLSLTSY